MGVKGLWKLIESAGVPVPLETLEHKVLGVDVSIWLHQAVRGFRGPGGAAVANAHLLTLFHRICKLLFYRIRPVFVFDGGVPYLKKQTLASRKLKREVATNKARQVRERLLKNLLKSQAVRNALGKSGPGPSSVHVPQVTKKEKDLFELPPLPEPLTEGTSIDNQEGKRDFIDSYDLPNLHHFDFESEEFKNMSIDMKHEILSELQDTRKQNSWATINDMPQQSENFADFQMARLMKRAKFQATLDSTREEIRKSKVSEMEEELFGDLEKYVSLSRRIVSEDASHAIFVKKASSEKNSKNVNVESDSKGKSPLKKKSLGKDFLTELARVGLIHHKNQHKDSDSDDESENYYPIHEKEWRDTEQQTTKIEEESFLQVVGSLMENSGLTQDEILTLIKQGERENVDVQCKNEVSDGPSTSANAPGSIYNPDADSSDDDDFIEVTNDPQSPKDEKEDQIDAAANNIEKLLGTKSNSLWMKLVQQKVDDMVYVNTMKTSPNKAIVDSRKTEKGSVCIQSKTPKEGSETLKPIKISLDFEVKPLKMEDNIFSDIFVDFVSQPKTKQMESLKGNNQESTQDISVLDTLNKSSNLNTSPQAFNMGHSQVEKYGSLSSRSGSCEEVLHEDVDEVELMSSGDDSEDEEQNPSNIYLSTPAKPQQSQTPFLGIFKHKNTDIKDSLPSEATSVDEINRDSSFNCLVSKDSKKIETNSLKKMAHNGNSPHVAKLDLPKDAVSQDVNFSTSQNVLLNGPSPTTPSTETTTLFSRNSCIINESTAGNSLSADSCTVESSSKKGTDTKKVDLEGNRDQQENSEVMLISTSLGGDISPETIKNKDMNGEHAKSVSKKETETSNSILSEGDHGKRIAFQNVTKKIVTDCIQESTYSEDQLKTDTDAGQKRKVLSSVEETEMEDSEIEKPVNYTEDELKHLEEELASEQQALVAQAQQSERVAASLNDQMYGESQYLLQLFGIPYLVAPMEAEAQCAFLNAANLTEGTITDDSDIFLFGGNSVYRNFFNQTRHVEHFKVDNIKSTLGLDRSKMITLALLSGSDYTEGIEGIGSVSGMEILTEFPGEGVECLQNLKKWWKVAHNGISTVQPSKIKQKLVQINLSDSFPNESVYEAYLTPKVDESREKFSWAVPNVEALRNFTGDKFGWNHAKADEILLPVMKKLSIKTSQKRIESYFTNIRLVKEPKVTSKRMQEAIAKAKGIKLPNCDNSSGKPQARQKRRKIKVIKDPESEPQTKESAIPPEAVQDPKSSTPRRTLLVDPSEIKSKSVAGGRKGQKRKKDSEEEDGQGQRSKKGPHPSDTQNIGKRKGPQKTLTKEDMFSSLLEKEKICQREKEKLEMEEKKMAAAEILQKQKKEKIKKR